jgi:hypothetical protein
MWKYLVFQNPSRHRTGIKNGINILSYTTNITATTKRHEKEKHDEKLKKIISSPNDGNIIGICNMLQREEKCMQNSSQNN